VPARLGNFTSALLGKIKSAFTASENIHFPYPSDGRTLTSFEWRPIRYRNVIAILKNPFYAGVYAYGKSEKRTKIIDGRARKSYGHHKPMGTWEVFIKDHHEGYISWDEYERNQAVLAGNAYCQPTSGTGPFSSLDFPVFSGEPFVPAVPLP
jgi:hypothetical protein